MLSAETMPYPSSTAAYPHPLYPNSPDGLYGHEAVYSIRLYNFIIVYQGASSKPLNKSSADHIKSIPKQHSSYRSFIVITAIISQAFRPLQKSDFQSRPDIDGSQLIKKCQMFKGFRMLFQAGQSFNPLAFP
jgi:hypothetical protein